MTKRLGIRIDVRKANMINEDDGNEDSLDQKKDKLKQKEEQLDQYILKFINLQI